MKEVNYAVYSGSRNLYPHMVTAAKSLVANSKVDVVWFLIEDAEFPDEVPDMVRTMDVSGQKFFGKSCPNMRTQFTYMSLLRVCYSKLFPDVPKILQLDVDTVCVDSVDALFDLKMGKAWVAACNELNGTYKPYGPRYYNIGVALFNLEQIRADGADVQAINLLNSTELRYIDQDAWNILANTRTIDLPSRYNETYMTGFTDSPAIVHYAGSGNGWLEPGFSKTPRLEYLKRYREMSWGEALDLHAKHVKKAR